MAILKLAEAPVTATILSASIAEGKFGPQVRFKTSNDDLIFVGEAAALRQLERLGMTLDDCAGQTLHFERVVKDGTNFTNIKRATGAPTAPAASHAVHSLGDIVARYSECLQAAVRLASSVEDDGYQATASDVFAMTATLFIQSNKR